MELTREHKIIQQVISEAWNNDEFKKALIADPIPAIEKLTGEKISLPKGRTLAAYDQSNPNVIYLNIPPKPNLDNVALNDQELEMVAGGVYPIGIIDGCFPPFPPVFEPPILTTY